MPSQGQKTVTKTAKATKPKPEAISGEYVSPFACLKGMDSKKNHRYEAISLVPGNYEEAKVCLNFAQALVHASKLVQGAVTKDKVLVARFSTIERHGLIMPDMESPKDKAARRYRELLETERETILDAIGDAISPAFYEQIRNEQLKNGDDVTLSISVALDTIVRICQAGVSGSVKLKSSGTSNYDDPGQMKLGL